MKDTRFLSALRDFFYVGTADQMEISYGVIKEATNSEYPVAPIDWENEEFIFNRMFVGPTAPTAPFISSLYIDPNEEVQGNITREVREFYNSIGLSLPQAGTIPEDSLPLEFDTCRYLLHLSEELPKAKDIYHEFIDEHMTLWLPKFTEQALLSCEDSIAIRDVLILIEGWINTESGKSLLTKELS